MGSTEIDIREIQKVVFEILCDIDAFCREKQFSYMLSGGTCLGAVREHGFIPWDDDGDIMLSRQEFYPFLCAFADAYKEKYHVSSLQTDEAWARPYAKIWSLNTATVNKHSVEAGTGLGVDVFPVDLLPPGKAKQKYFFEKLKLLDILRNSARRTDYYDYEKFIFLKKILGLFTKNVSPRRCSERMEKFVISSAPSQSDFAGAVMALHYWEKELMPASVFQNTLLMEFSAKSFPVPEGYDTYLTALYGDYMTPPDKPADHSFIQDVSMK